MTHPETVTVTRLTPTELAVLRVRATREAGAFVDPLRLRRIHQWAPRIHAEWAQAILGHAWNGPRSASWRDLVLLDLAHEVEPNPPEPPSVAAARERRAHEASEQYARDLARFDEWQRLRAALPVRVEVVHNYTSARHLEFYVQGVDHIMLREPLAVGRLRRPANHTLCWTPSRAKYLAHFSHDYPDRVPECKACLRLAERIAR